MLGGNRSASAAWASPPRRSCGVIGLIVAGTLEFDVQRDLGTLPMGRKVAQFGLAFLVAVALHALWDSQKSVLGTVVVGVVSLVVLGITVHRRAAVPRSPHPDACG